LFYLEDTFNLNEKADAAEAFLTILSLLHASNAPNLGQKANSEGILRLDLDEECKRAQNQACEVHKLFKISQVTCRKCLCGALFPPEQTDMNNFSLIVNVNDIL
jgi:hypothetical protein